jgi:hypothetical protein
VLKPQLSKSSPKDDIVKLNTQRKTKAWTKSLKARNAREKNGERFLNNRLWYNGRKKAVYMYKCKKCESNEYVKAELLKLLCGWLLLQAAKTKQIGYLWNFLACAFSLHCLTSMWV